MTTDLWGKPFGDRGYPSQALFEQFFGLRLRFIAPIRKNILNRSALLHDAMPYRNS